MHLSLLLILSLFSHAHQSFGSPADVLYIQKCLSDYTLIANSGSLSGVPDFSPFNKIFTNNVTFDVGPPYGFIRGLANVVALFKNNLPPGTVTQTAVTTQSISLSDFDDQGSASEATALSYYTDTYFGQGNLTGQIFTLYYRYEDTLVKTNLQGNGGWRITTRIMKYFGPATGIGNPAILPAVVSGW